MRAPPVHQCEVLGSPRESVYATRIRSARHYARHSHGTFGFGVVDEGAHRSGSGRGTVDALAGDLLVAPTLAELAVLAGVSRFQLLRRFAAQVGFTPGAWQRAHGPLQ
jgi:AraC-like DNA-binding protein